MDEITFWVPGVPAPGGSKRGIFNRKTGHVAIFENNPIGNRNWRAAVALAASEAMAGREIFSGALSLKIMFHLPRPKAHYNTKGILKKTAPCWHTSKPDITKLCRSTEDALTGVIWKDDALIASSNSYKIYAANQAGAQIRVSQLIF